MQRENFIPDMLFTSLSFLVFLTIVVVLNYVLPQQWRKFLLLGASYYFYLSLQPIYLLLLLFVTLLTYFGARWLACIQDIHCKTRLLWLFAVLLLGELFVFKYYNFVQENCNILLEHCCMGVLPRLRWMLPVGISFFTFQSLGYLIDVSDGKYSPEKRFCNLALYVSFFPIILSGPIERGNHLLPQLDNPSSRYSVNIVQGGRKMLWGYFLKLVIAERIFAYTEVVFASPEAWSRGTLWLGGILYPMGIYADFAGYSLVAIGVASLLGFSILENFNRPFFAETIPSFWRRWHISLTTWLTDYLYTPLSIRWRELGIWAAALASFVVFLSVGIWHGASWNYIGFGVLHGMFVAVSALMQKKRKKFEKKHSLKNSRWYKGICIFFTYLFVMLAFVLFRTTSLTKAVSYYRGMLINQGPVFTGVSNVVFAVMLFVSALLFVCELLQEYWNIHLLSHGNRGVRWGCYVFIIMGLLLLGKFGENSFVYLQF